MALLEQNEMKIRVDRPVQIYIFSTTSLHRFSLLVVLFVLLFGFQFQVSPKYIRLCKLRNEDRASNPLQFFGPE